MTRPDLSDAAKVAQYRAELRAVGRNQRLGGFGLVILGAIAVWAAASAGAAGPTVQWVGYAALALGWALMLTAIFLRTRYHRQRMREDV
jgi:cobalamin synthase